VVGHKRACPPLYLVSCDSYLLPYSERLIIEHPNAAPAEGSLCWKERVRGEWRSLPLSRASRSGAGSRGNLSERSEFLVRPGPESAARVLSQGLGCPFIAVWPIPQGASSLCAHKEKKGNPQGQPVVIHRLSFSQKAATPTVCPSWYTVLEWGIIRHTGFNKRSKGDCFFLKREFICKPHRLID
jgi:hypothetical protein